MNSQKIESIIDDSKIYLVSSLPNHTGGMFLCSLLDGHPDAYVLPHSIHRIFPANEDTPPNITEFLNRLKNDESYKVIYGKLSKDNSLEKIESFFVETKRKPSVRTYIILILIYFYTKVNSHIPPDISNIL